MDEITRYAELKPPADRLEEEEARVRARLAAAFAGAPAGAVPGEARRRRRRLLALVAVAAAAAGAAVVVPVVLPGGGTSTPLVSKAWAVQRNSDGTITVSVAQLAEDPSGLERALRAEGVPAVVRFSQVNDPGYRASNPADVPGLCIPPTASRVPIAVQQAVITMRVVPGGQYPRHEFVIRPSAMPTGSAVYLSNVKITGSGYPGAVAFTIWVLKQDRLPPCGG